MKKLRILTLALLLPAFVMTGCTTGGDNPGDAQIELPNNSEKTQTAFADDETSGGFTFTAKQAWTATVTETTTRASDGLDSATRASGVEWLRLLFDGEETYSGAAGKFTLVIELDENYSGETRTATITIKSGNDTITITVTQDGKTETGDVPQQPRLITSITNTAEMNSDRGFYETDSYEFKYYENDFRLKEFQIIHETYTSSYIYDYSTLNEVAITDGYDDVLLRAALNSKGYASTIRERYGDEYTLTYDANDYLEEAVRGESFYWDYVWDNGNLVDIIGDYYEASDRPSYYFTTEQNDKTNIDWNIFFTEFSDGRFGYYDDPYHVDLLALIDKAGKRSRNYIIPAPSKPGSAEDQLRYYTEETEPEAGAVVRTGYDVENSGEPFYSFDSEGYPTTYTWKESVVKSESTYTGEREYVYPSDEREREQWEQRFGPGPWFDLVTTTQTYPAVIDTYRWNIEYSR